MDEYKKMEASERILAKAANSDDEAYNHTLKAMAFRQLRENDKWLCANYDIGPQQEKWRREGMSLDLEDTLWMDHHEATFEREKEMEARIPGYDTWTHADRFMVHNMMDEDYVDGRASRIHNLLDRLAEVWIDGKKEAFIKNYLNADKPSQEMIDEHGATELEKRGYELMGGNHPTLVHKEITQDDVEVMAQARIDVGTAEQNRK